MWKTFKTKDEIRGAIDFIKYSPDKIRDCHIVLGDELKIYVTLWCDRIVEDELFLQLHRGNEYIGAIEFNLIDSMTVWYKPDNKIEEHYDRTEDYYELKYD